METKELRIGNLVNLCFHHKPGWFPATVTRIYTNSIDTDTEDGDDKEYYFEGIPLTEEWLIRFGFTGDVNSGFGKDAIELNYITTDEHFEFEYKTSSKAWMLVPIKFVHQLQNLYYALTGNELTNLRTH